MLVYSQQKSAGPSASHKWKFNH